ncbi:MAG: creatininase family protein [Defluviitaleaceae bacterium]|nr:creatininase family protein [Defluviitaleaceae bacterium]MCL2835325.1 creatininase family protein [Defluviitaleaceae bacterium]
MHLIHLRPDELKTAVARNIPVILAAGSIEYHGPQNPIGTDYLIAEAVVQGIEKRMPKGCVVAPPLPFSSTMQWAGHVTEGDVDFSPDALYVYALELFTQLTNMGFKRIYVVQHHQGPEGIPYLTLRRAAAEVIRQTALRWGHSWGRGKHADLPNPDIFSLIIIAHPASYAVWNDSHSEPFPFGHGGKGETQIMMAAYPETVDMAALKAYEGTLPEWLLDADQSAEGEGRKWLDAFVDGWIKELTKYL